VGRATSRTRRTSVPALCAARSSLWALTAAVWRSETAAAWTGVEAGAAGVTARLQECRAGQNGGWEDSQSPATVDDVPLRRCGDLGGGGRDGLAGRRRGSGNDRAARAAASDRPARRPVGRPAGAGLRSPSAAIARRKRRPRRREVSPGGRRRRGQRGPQRRAQQRRGQRRGGWQ
jgi:hypothetical protein